MVTLKGTETEKNLLKSFAGESQARNRYTYFASVAKSKGYEQISAIFLETADNEKEHAKIFFQFLEGGEAEIVASYPAGVIDETSDNLLAAAEGEKLEWGTLYPAFAKTALNEGFHDVATAFTEISEVEQKHEKRYRTLLDRVKKGTVFKRENEVEWKCRNCGYIHHGKEAPKICPACKHPRSYYELNCENY
jgi:rubrerythrin